MSYKNHTWTDIAKDFNSQLIRGYIFSSGFAKYPEVLGIPRLRIAVISKRNAITYCADLDSWKACHEALKKKVEQNYNLVNEIIDKTNELGKQTNAWTKKHILDADLTKKSPKELVGLLKRVIERVGDLYLWGVTLPILDFASFSFVEGNLMKYLKEKSKNEGEYQKYYSVFTAPIANSFQQDQEEDLLQLMEEFYNQGTWREDVQTLTVAQLKIEYPEFYKKLEEHTKKYCWVYYVFSGPAFTEENFVDFIKDDMFKKTNPEEKLKNLVEKKRDIKQKKEQYLKELNPDPFHRAILEVAGKLVWGKPRRKDYQSCSYYHLEKLQREIGKRLNLSLQEVRCMPLEMIEDALLDGKPVDKKIIQKIYECHACVPNDDGSVNIIYGKEAEEFEKNIVREKEEKSTTLELKGMCACTGAAEGIVKIVNTAEDMQKMNYGDILVSIATTPTIVLAMKKAAAIVTDEGGLTCHASIVSRELGVPCIIGTKIATKLLKDGDIVEVDATKGIITILKKSNASQ